MKTALRVTAVLAAGCFSISSVTAPAIAAEPAPVAAKVSDLKALCTPGGVQQLAFTGLATVAWVKEITNGAKLPGGVRFVAASERTQAYCEITGSFVTNDKTGKTANFSAAFPENWNGRYYQSGCSGTCGHVAGASASVMAAGYAQFATDEGHNTGVFDGRRVADTPYWERSWAQGPDRADVLEDLFYRADQMLARMGKQATAQFYSRASGARQKIAYSYFNGCSGGGRDAFVAASYFPEEFDGIIGGSPFIDMTRFELQEGGIMFAQLRSEGAYVPNYLLEQINPIVKAKCDALDGVKDGLIQNPAACDFRADRDLPRCDAKSSRTECFTDEQIETVSVALSAVTDETGKVVFPGHAVSDLRDVRLSDMPKDITAPVIYGPGEPADTRWLLGQGNIRDWIMYDQPGYQTRNVIQFKSGGPGPVNGFHTVVPSSLVAKIDARGRMGIGDIPENAKKLIGLNRKFIIYQDLSDELLVPYPTINYYKRLAKMFGGYEKLQKNVRLFAIPGSGHCRAGGNGSSSGAIGTPGPRTFEMFAPLENWVEKGVAPEAITAALYDPDGGAARGKKPIRTMPLCKFPTMARYSGNGDVNDAANWSCPASDSSMLKVGESGKLAGVDE